MTNRFRGSWFLGLLLLCLCSTTLQAFVAKSNVAFAAPRSSRSLARALPPNLAVDTSALSSSIAIADGMEIVKNVLIGVGGIVAILLLITVVFSTYLMPETAKQLESQAKEVDPALWEEYISKLEPGETLAMRPDLMQELSNKVLAIYDVGRTKKMENGEGNTPPPHGDVEAEVLCDKEDKDKGS